MQLQLQLHLKIAHETRMDEMEERVKEQKKMISVRLIRHLIDAGADRDLSQVKFWMKGLGVVGAAKDELANRYGQEYGICFCFCFPRTSFFRFPRLGREISCNALMS